MDLHRDELRAWDTDKGTLRFTPEHPLPVDLVATMVRERMARIDAGGR